MIEYVLMLSAVLVAAASLYPKDLMKAVIICTGIEGLALAALYQELLASDAALTQAVVAATVLPGIFAIAVYKTGRWEE